MSDKQTTRRSFLKILGITAGATVAGNEAVAGLTEKKEILRLTGEQQEFMLLYEKWMDEFIEVIRIQKTDPHHVNNRKKMMTLTQTAEGWQPRLREYMKDQSFYAVYTASIERMKREIQ